jgi:hypothetical protein
MSRTRYSQDPEIDVEKMKKMIQAVKKRRAQTAPLIEMKGE